MPKNKAKEKETISSALSRLLELPESSLGGEIHIEINSQREAVVENCRGVLEYTPERIRLLAGKTVVRFCGRGLSIGSMDKSGAVVSGVITSIEFLS